MAQASLSPSAPVQRYLLLPPRGLQASASVSSAHLGPLMAGLAPRRAGAGAAARGLRVLDTVHEDGIKLVEMDEAAVRRMRLQAPGLRIVPEVFYRTARLPMAAVTARVQAAASSGTQLLRVVDGQGAAVAGATVVAFTDFANGIGAQGRTAANGSVRLKLGTAPRLQRLYVYPLHSQWPMLLRNVLLPRTAPVVLPGIDLAEPDSLRHFAQRAPKGDGAGVVVGIVDTGVGPHLHLPVAGGLNTVTGEDPADWHDSDQHGSHVAGIVGARGQAPTGMRGLAPACTLRAYRVFGQNSDGASNFAIAKAIDRAVADGCDLLNLSLGGGPADPATSAAIADARAAGVVVVCASGNDGADEVSQPGADTRAVAVGAFGRQGLAPARSVSAAALGRPGTDNRNRMADFSNRGLALDLAGPGVGVVSTVPGDRWAVMDGTSMACPAVTGAVARLLGRRPALLGAARDQQRSDAILQLVFGAARVLGFGPEYEGYGWPSTS